MFNDDLPIDRLWLAGWISARRFVAALNIATRAFWWWHLPRQISKYYDRVDDLQNAMEVKLDRSPVLKIGWGSNLVLDQEALRQTVIHMSAIMRLGYTEGEAALAYYLGGLTFLSLNEIHWQCESQAYGNFHHCIKTWMKLYGGWNGVKPFESAFSELLSQFAPTMSADEHSRFIAIARTFELGTPESAGVNLSDVGLIKVLCDAYFTSAVAPAVLKDLEARAVEESAPESTQNEKPSGLT